MKIYIIYLKTNWFLYILPFPKKNLLQILLIPTARTWTSWKYKYNLFTFVIINVLCSLEGDLISTMSQPNLVWWLIDWLSYLLGNCSYSTETQYLAFDSEICLMKKEKKETLEVMVTSVLRNGCDKNCVHVTFLI